MYSKFSMVGRFLKGAKRYFLLALLASMIVSGLDVIVPRLIQIMVDVCLAGGREASRFGRALLWLMGGEDLVRTRFWIPAAAVLAVGILQALFRTMNTDLATRGAEDRKSVV